MHEELFTRDDIPDMSPEEIRREAAKFMTADDQPLTDDDVVIIKNKLAEMSAANQGMEKGLEEMLLEATTLRLEAKRKVEPADPDAQLFTDAQGVVGTIRSKTEAGQIAREEKENMDHRNL